MADCNTTLATAIVEPCESPNVEAPNVEPQPFGCSPCPNPHRTLIVGLEVAP